MYLCVWSIDFDKLSWIFYWILELFQRCGLFFISLFGTASYGLSIY